MAFEKFREWYDNRHQYQKEYKDRTRKKIVGFFCTYEPEEILYAADILPVRIVGGHRAEDLSLANAHVFNMYCPFCRDALAQGLKGYYDYLDGLSIAERCLHIRQTYHSWTIHKELDWTHTIYMPYHVQSLDRAIPYLYEELKVFKRSLEEWTGREITEDDLKRGITILNRNRRAMKKAFQYSRSDPPRITGSERFYMTTSSFFVDKEEHSRVVEEAINELDGRKMDHEDKARLMLIGSENDDMEFVKMVESMGASIVIDDHCTTTRYFWDEVDESADDPLLAIAERYVKRIPCPSCDWPERKRFDRILQFVKDWNVQGAILIQQKFCDPHEADTPFLKKFLEEHNIPTYQLEFDVTVPIGSFKIRVEAFLETLSGMEDFF
ncbi:MAG: 2-hydroxyacyl-CoA dehydratase [Thermodesulfobacteriota bacterium]|nr:2-hydroxyacyl-CoA dehydratase [Thermodesulfobacteriota bacterium]